MIGINFKLKEDSVFAQNVYLGLEGAKTGELTYSEFKINLEDEGFRMKLATSMALTEGSYVRQRPLSGVIPGKTYGYRQAGIPTVVYDRYNGNVPLAVGEGIKKPTVSNKGYTVTKEYKQFQKKAFLLCLNTSFFFVCQFHLEFV